MPTDTESEVPKPLTAEEIANIVNAAITAREKRATESTKKLIEESLKSLAPPKAPEVEKDASKNPEILALQQRLESMTKAVEESETKRATAERKQREDSAYNTLRKTLEGKVRPDMLEVAAQYLFAAQKRVEFAEDGTPLFRVRRAPSPGMAEEDMQLPLSDGVESYLKSKEASVFLPAPATAGAPPAAARRSTPIASQQNSRPPTTDVEKVRDAMMREQAFKESQK